MADDKKPKIDLKARLGRNQAATPPPSGVLPPPSSGLPPPAIPAPVQMPVSPSNPAPAIPGVPVGPAPFALDPSNPLTAAITGAAFRPTAPPEPAKPQRIELDESQITEARSAGVKRGVGMGLGAAVVALGIGFFSGQASEAGSVRKRSKSDAEGLAKDLDGTKGALEKIAETLEKGRGSLLKDKKFPDGLGAELNKAALDFDGTKLAGIRFSGFPQDLTGGLFEVISGVQEVKDKKLFIQGLLNVLQKPLTEEFNAKAGGKTVIRHVALIGGPTGRDPSGNALGILGELTSPIAVVPPNFTGIPDNFAGTELATRQAFNVTRYKGGDLGKPSAVYVLPKSFDSACPSGDSQKA
ncbi:MAG: hypothetical protein KBF88_12025, partial [Polyangiaceae bacterium]|nr:hypothetical protein [Polyangiaceae bacterium]